MKKIKFIALILLLSTLLPTVKANTVDTIPTKRTSTFENIASWYMENMNYGTITLLMTVESTFIPFPSEIIVPPAAYKASQPNSDLNIVLVVIFATLGALCGAMINYHLALWLGRPIVHKFAESKIGKMCLLSSAKVQNAEDYFVKHGKSSTFVGRLVPGIRHLISIPAGLAKMKLLPFTIFTVIGAGIWNIILALMGYIAQGQSDMIKKYSSELSYGLYALGVLLVAYFIYSGINKKRKKKANAK